MDDCVIYREFNEESYNYVAHKAEDCVLRDHDLLLKVKACSLSSGCNTEILTELFLKKPKVRLSASNCVAGIVINVGPLVTRCVVGDYVTGVLPLDADCSGCAHSCCISEFDIVKLPESVDFESAACCIGDGIRAYIALHYLGHIQSGDTILVMDAATAFGSLAVQLAHGCGCKVLAVIANDQDRSHLQKLSSAPEHIIEVDSKTAMSALYSSVMEETGRLGVDVFIDNGVRLFVNDEDQRNYGEIRMLPTKHDVISCLAVGGRWITSCPSLQLDPPNSVQLFLRGSSVSFLFEHSWSLSAVRQGRLLHIMQDVVSKLADGSLKPHISQIVPFSNAMSVLEKADERSCGKIVIRLDSDV
jgi:NADPH:quinone reductase-like Zn-dependent oxidoreductase